MNPTQTGIAVGLALAVIGSFFIRLGKSGGKHSIQLTYTVTSTIIQNSGQSTKNYQTAIGLR